MALQFEQKGPAVRVFREGYSIDIAFGILHQDTELPKYVFLVAAVSGEPIGNFALPGDATSVNVTAIQERVLHWLIRIDFLGDMVREIQDVAGEISSVLQKYDRDDPDSGESILV